MGSTTFMMITFGLYTALLLGISVYSNRSMAGSDAGEQMDEFYTGGRGAGGFITAMVLASGIASAGTFVGTPGLTYSNGLVWTVLTNWQNFMNLMVLGVVGKKIGIISRRINARSFLDVYASRYEDNKAVILIAGIGMLVFLLPYSSVQFIGGARMFEVMSGVNYRVGLLLMAGIVILYTSFGGIKGTQMASAVQGFVMTLAAILIFVFTVYKLGGLGEGMKMVQAIEPELLQARGVGGIAVPHYIASFAVLFGIAMIGMPHGITPALTFKNSKSMLRSVIIGAVAVTIWTVLMSTTGTLARAVDPNLAVPDHATATVTMWAMPVALRGIILAGVTAAMQSTVASMMILLSGSLLMDVYAKVLRPNTPDEKLNKMTRPITLALGMITFVIALFPPDALEWIVYFAIAGLESAFFVPLLVGLYWRKGTTQGAIASMVGGLGSYIIISGYLTQLAFGMHPVVVSLLISVICYVVGSLISPEPPREVIQLYWGRYPIKES